MKLENTSPLSCAIKIAGGVTKLARSLDLSGHATVYQWEKNRVPAEYCPRIEALTGVRCEALRPDVRWDVITNRHPAPTVEVANA